jgi:hypothetical protein
MKWKPNIFIIIIKQIAAVVQAWSQQVTLFFESITRHVIYSFCNFLGNVNASGGTYC